MYTEFMQLTCGACGSYGSYTMVESWFIRNDDPVLKDEEFQDFFKMFVEGEDASDGESTFAQTYIDAFLHNYEKVTLKEGGNSYKIPDGVIVSERHVRVRMV